MKSADVMDAVKDAYKAAQKEDADKGDIWVGAAMKVLASCTSQQAEEQFYDLMAGICEGKPDDIRNRSLDGLMEDVKRIYEENNIENFLHAASDFAEKL